MAGTVTDPSGAPVPNSRLRMTNAANDRSREVQTKEAGVYAAPFLAPGCYDITVEATGFKMALRRGVDIQVDVKARIDIAMEIGTRAIRASTWPGTWRAAATSPGPT